MRRSLPWLLLTLIAALPALAADSKAILPPNFDGWQRQSDHVSTDPSAADPANGPLLKEYGFTAVEQASYTKPGRQLAVKAARFDDVSGAFGAYTFYKTGDMQAEKVGDRGASQGLRVLFQQGNIVVTATFDRVTAMSAAEMRDLAGELPPMQSGAAPPTIPNYLPAQGLVEGTVRYIVGPLGLQAAGTPLPPAIIDFSKGAEVATANYSTTQGTAITTVISYPTPQIATQHLHDVVSFLQSKALAGNARSDQFAKRSGPIVAVVTGDVSPSEAKSLLASINYDADVTWNQNTYRSKKENVANLLVNIIYLIGILFLFALVLGIFFGGVRVIAKRLFPDKIFDRPDEMEIIRLNLRD